MTETTVTQGLASLELLAAIERARSHKMTPQERFDQQVSFVSEGVDKARVRAMLIDKCAVPQEIIDEAHAAGLAEGVAMGIEAAARTVRDEVYAEAQDTEWDTGFNYAKKLAVSMVLHLDPAAILAQHRRTKAMDSAADAELVWQCPLEQPDCKSNCGSYGCGN